MWEEDDNRMRPQRALRLEVHVPSTGEDIGTQDPPISQVITATTTWTILAITTAGTLNPITTTPSVTLNLTYKVETLSNLTPGS